MSPLIAADAPPRIRPLTWAQPVIGTQLENFHQVSPEVYRSGQPTARDLKLLVEQLGIKSVLTLRDLHDDADEAEERASAFDTIGESFKGLSELPLWNEQTKADLKSLQWHFTYQLDELREGLPGEPDYEREPAFERPSIEDIDIDELFRDL